MKFDADRFAKLAGLSADKAVSTPVEATARAVMTEGRKQKSTVVESAEMTKLRSFIRTEAAAALKRLSESKLAVKSEDIRKAQRAKSLTEAVTLGFYGPGFGNNKSFVLGGPMTSAARLSSLAEAADDEELELESDAPSDEEGTLTAEADTCDESDAPLDEADAPSDDDDVSDEDEED